MSYIAGTLHFVCTGSGRHPEIRLGHTERAIEVRLDPGTRRVLPTGLVGSREFHAVTLARVEVVAAPDGHRTVSLRCPHQRCPRHIVWREERAIRIAEQAIAAGLSVLDISRVV